MSLSPIELRFIAEFLDEHEDRLGNDGCNDYIIKDTPEHRALLEAAERTNSDDPGEWAETHLYNKGQLITTNTKVVGHLKARVLAVLNGEE